MLLCPQRHGPPGRGNTMALKDERSPKYAFPGAGTSLLKSPIEKACCIRFLVSQCWLLGAAAAAAVPTKTRPSRTGKHHGPEGRMESKIGVSRGRNVPSEISEKKLLLAILAIRFSTSRCCCAHKDTALPDGETPWP